MNELVAFIGYAVLGCSALAMMLVCLGWFAVLVNKTVRNLLESYGGVKVFMEFKEWYHKNKDVK